VGLVVMPFSALYEVLQNTWFFGTDWCDTWRSLDVLFSTASILNLCVISLDRYWAITDPFSYPMKMTRNRAVVLIAAVWICSSLISFPAIVFWRHVRLGPMPEFKCTFTEHLGYLVFSSTISFYLPLLVMVFTYCRIYRAAAEQTRSLKLGTKQVLMTSGEMQLTLRIHRGGTTREEPDEEPLSALHNNGIRHRHNVGKNFSLSRKLAKFAKEKKAAKTLGIVMGRRICISMKATRLRMNHMRTIQWSGKFHLECESCNAGEKCFGVCFEAQRFDKTFVRCAWELKV
jgi:dopamine receptor D1-like